jgi:hypothetical protein
VDIRKMISPNFQATHSVELSDRGNAYAFGAAFGGQRSLFSARIDPAGNVQSVVRFEPIKDFMTLKTIASAVPAQKQLQVTLDASLTGVDWTADGKVATGFFKAGYCHSVTDDLVVGFDCAHLTARRQTLYSVGARLEHTIGFEDKVTSGKRSSKVAPSPSTTFASMSSLGTLTVAHAVNVTKATRAAAELQINTRTLDSALTVGYQMAFDNAVVKACADTQGRVCASVSHQLVPGIQFSLSGDIIYPKNQHSFGIAVDIGV